MLEFIIGLLLILIGLLLIPYGDIKSVSENKKTILATISFSSLLIGILLFTGSVQERTISTTYKKALKDNPYEMVIRYELKDSIIIPVDTVYTLKK